LVGWLGVSLYRYVTQRRLIAAKNDIAKGMRLDAVARKSGFQDYSAFFRVFKSTFGISPRQYRIHEDTTASHIV
jgi:AraC-like DNA-binding protein